MPERLTFSLALVFAWFVGVAAVDAGDGLTFEHDVRPIFKAYCLDCHGAGEALKGHLDLRLKRFAERGGDSERTIADIIDGVALRAMHAHEGQASLRCWRLCAGGFACTEQNCSQREDEPWQSTEPFSNHLICFSSSGSLGGQCRERRRVGAIFLPSRIGGIGCELVLAPPFASRDRAYALKVAHDLRVGVRDFHPIELDLVHTPIQQQFKP